MDERNEDMFIRNPSRLDCFPILMCRTHDTMSETLVRDSMKTKQWFLFMIPSSQLDSPMELDFCAFVKEQLKRLVILVSTVKFKII